MAAKLTPPLPESETATSPRVPGAGKTITDDPIGLRSPTLVHVVSAYMRWYFGRSFGALRVPIDGLPDVSRDQPVIVYSNHPSWWDPVVFIVLNGAIFPGRPGYGPIDAQALEKYRFFRRIGIFGIEGGSRRGAARFLRVGTRILSDPRAVLWVTAEGAFTDARARPLRLRPGVAHLAHACRGAALLPLAVEYAFWNERFPEAFVRFGPVIADTGSGRSAEDWHDLIAEKLTDTMDRLAADVRTRDPARFQTLLEGRAGVGLAYDLWRRLRAAATGRPFTARHGDRVR